MRTTTSLMLMILILSTLAPSLRAQLCTDPPVPANGFPITQVLGATTTWSDGYQALTDVRYPSTLPGPCGWPLVILIHGAGGNRTRVASDAQSLARQGYITFAYDVRGHAPSMALNPLNLAHDVTGLRELIDLFEAMETAETIYPDLVDFNRIGVTGYSQGGSHSWWAAQHSGLLPPPNPWRTQAFPLVSAVAVRDSGAGIGRSFDAFGNATVDRFFGPPSIVFQPIVLAQIRALILLEDGAGLDAATTAPGMDPTVLLPLTTVPVLAHASYDDKRVNPSGVHASWELVPDTTPKRLLLGTGGHDSPLNEQDQDRFKLSRLLWFDRFLKDEMNGIDVGPRILATVTPENVPEYRDPTTLWDFRTQDVIPAPATMTQRFHLGPGGQLLGGVPAAGSNPIAHVVPAGLDMASYTTWLPTPAQLIGAIPISNQIYTSAVLVTDRLLQGRIAVNLTVNANQPDFQLQAVIHDLPPAGNPRYVTSGSIAVRGNAGPQTLTLETYLQSYVFRQGHQIVLELRNLVLHTPPTGNGAEIKSVPFFTSSLVGVGHGGAIPSFIDVPFLPYEEPTLATYPLFQSAASLVNQTLAIRTNSVHAGAPYFLLASFAGTAPGTPVGAITMPLNFDALTFALIANPALPPFVNALGVLDAEGSAYPGLALNGVVLPPAAAGLELSMAALVASTTLHSTNPVVVPIVP